MDTPHTLSHMGKHEEQTLYYGLNAMSSNLIMVDRKPLNNPNDLILGDLIIGAALPHQNTK